MDIILYNSLTKKKEVFVPIDPKEAKLYTCGMTVYDYAHIGHGRKYVMDDILKRVLIYNGYKVKHVQNVTDVGHLVSDADEGEDKMMKGLKREGLDFSVDSMLKLANIYTDTFMENLKDLNIQTPDVMPKATEHVKEMIEIVDGLIKKGYVYETSTSFYFDTSKFPNYSKLGNLNLDELNTEARIEGDDEKRKAADFSVWMKALGKNAHHVMVWDAPFSSVKGFPGWHIECSAMAMKHLGQQIDIHSGGIDHIKVHHTNEIAQSEGFTDKQFVKYWVHNEFLVLTTGKMSKSEGTFVTLNELKDKGFKPMAYRFLCLQAHYRSPLTFSFESLQDAQNGLENLYDKIINLGDHKGNVDQKYLAEFKEIINQDFDTAKGLALVFLILKDNKLSDADKKATVFELDKVLGLGLDSIKIEKEEAPTRVVELANERLKAKQSKDFDLADKLREEIAKDGWIIEDNKDGFVLKRNF